MTMRYFDKPTQVMFNDPESGEWGAGIAYRDEIICGCCGGIFKISEVIEAANTRDVKCAIYSYSNWNNLEYEIIGSVFPEGLERNNDFEIYETEAEDYEQYTFLLEDEEEAAVFANSLVDGVAMPSVD